MSSAKNGSNKNNFITYTEKLRKELLFEAFGYRCQHKDIITKQGVDLIEKNLINSQYLEDLVMLSRLLTILRKELEPTDQDLNFYRYKIKKILSSSSLKYISSLEAERERYFLTKSFQVYKNEKREFLKNNFIYHEDVLAIYCDNFFVEKKFWYCDFELKQKIKSFQEISNSTLD